VQGATVSVQLVFPFRCIWCWVNGERKAKVAGTSLGLMFGHLFPALGFELLPLLSFKVNTTQAMAPVCSGFDYFLATPIWEGGCTFSIS
jgi:hypothetical protein